MTRNRLRFIDASGCFDGAAYSTAFWLIASPAYDGAEFPVPGDPAADGLTAREAVDLTLQAIITHSMAVATGGTPEDWASMDFVSQLAALVAEVGSGWEDRVAAELPAGEVSSIRVHLKLDRAGALETGTVDALCGAAFAGMLYVEVPNRPSPLSPLAAGQEWCPDCRRIHQETADGHHRG